MCHHYKMIQRRVLWRLANPMENGGESKRMLKAWVEAGLIRRRCPADWRSVIIPIGNGIVGRLLDGNRRQTGKVDRGGDGGAPDSVQSPRDQYLGRTVAASLCVVWVKCVGAVSCATGRLWCTPPAYFRI